MGGSKFDVKVSDGIDGLVAMGWPVRPNLAEAKEVTSVQPNTWGRRGRPADMGFSAGLCNTYIVHTYYVDV